MIDQAIEELAPVVGTKAACAAVGRPRPSHYRRHRKSPAPPPPERLAARQPRALKEVERKEVLRVLRSDDHVDEASATVYAKLLDQGIYLGSISTMYRILRANDEVRERRRQATHPPAKKPELLATKANEVYSWDITKLLGPEKWSYYYLYVIIDIYSRYVPGWMLARAERAHLAERLLADTIAKQGVAANQLTIHADRGASMASKPVAFLLADLGVTRATAVPTARTTTPSARASSRPSSTGRSSPPASAASRMPTPSTAASSPGTTTSIVIRASACTPPPTSTTAGHPLSSNDEPQSSTPPTPPTPSASSASRPHPFPFPRLRGSTNRRRLPSIQRIGENLSRRG